MQIMITFMQPAAALRFVTHSAMASVAFSCRASAQLKTLRHVVIRKDGTVPQHLLKDIDA
jgi:hypothetical protein